MVSEQTHFLNNFHCEKNLLPFCVFVFIQSLNSGIFPPVSYDRETVREIARPGRRGFRGGGAHAFFQGSDPLPTQRVPPLYYFEISILVTDPKKFLKAPSAPANM